MRSYQYIFLILIFLIIGSLNFYEVPVLGFWRMYFVNDNVSELEKLKIENQSLRITLEKYFAWNDQFNNIAPIFSSNTEALIYAPVFARYPFSFKDEIIIGKGSNDGVSVNMAVVTQGVLIGRVKIVKEKYSLVQTVFDSKFELPVRLGSKGTPALLIGGFVPKITLIPRTEHITRGTAVYGASLDLPYGIPIGEIGTPLNKEGEIWEEAELQILYKLDSVQIMALYKN